MPTIGIMILMFTNSYVAFIPLQAKKMLIILTAIGTLILPALMVPLFLLQGKISNLEMDDRRERLYPLALTAVFYSLTFVLFLRIPVFKLIHAFMLGTMLSVIAGFLTSLKWKVSTHMIGLGGLAGLILVLSFKLDIYLLFPFIGVIIASGIAGSSRLYLEAHTGPQVYAGFGIGFVLMVVSLMLY
jgi:hypothetical protein